MLKYTRLQHYASQKLPDGQAGFRKGRETRDQIANICWTTEKARELKKKSVCFINNAKVFDCVDHEKLWKALREMGIPDHLLVFWESCMRVKKQQLEPCMKQLIGSRSRKECDCFLLSPCLFNLYTEHIMRNAGLDELQARIKVGRRNNNLR